MSGLAGMLRALISPDAASSLDVVPSKTFSAVIAPDPRRTSLTTLNDPVICVFVSVTGGDFTTTSIGAVMNAAVPSG